jgi:phosphomannomutase
MNKDIFKAYDIRGIYPTEINASDVKNIAKAYATWLQPKKVALGRDVRLSGGELWSAAAEGLTEMGVDVADLGVISTDMLYFAVANYGLDGGITISASHNAGEYNGMKLVREGSRPISIDTGIAKIRDLAITGSFENSGTQGTVERLNVLDDYVKKMVTFVNKNEIKPFSVVVNPNFGASGVAIQKIADYFGITITKINFNPDGHFPKGKPDPLQPSNREETEALIKSGKYAFGATWDADADRCFFYDEKGNFIQPYYITGLMIEYFLAKNPGAKILTDPRLRWLPRDLIAELGGEYIINKSGHSFIKERMRKDDILFGAETSAHYYFKELWYTDNGMVPFIIMLQVLSSTDKPFSELISKFQSKYFVIPETNYTVPSVGDAIARIKTQYSDGKIDEIDGFSCEYSDWRFNVRGSNTEPLLRLNLEAKSQVLAEEKLKELTKLINI